MPAAKTALGESHPGLAPTRTTLANGVVLLAKETRTMPAVTINIAVRAGSSGDPAGQAGAMSLLARVLDRGTGGPVPRSADEIAEALDSRGITLDVTVTRDFLSLVCSCLTEDFEPVTALIGAIIRSPTVPEAELATRKREVVTAIRQDEDSPTARAFQGLLALLYPDPHPYGRPTKGTVDIVEGLTRDRLLAQHARWFAPGSLSVVVVGHVEPALAEAVTARAFGDWTTSKPESAPHLHLVPSTTRRRLVIPMMKKAQAEIAYGFVTLPRSDPAYNALWLMNHAFGQYSMSGRLGDRIRERQGMAYHVSGTLDANLMQGPLLVRAGVSPSNVDRAVASIDEEVDQLVRDGLTETEINDSRQYLIYAMPRGLETNVGIAKFLQNAELHGLGLDYDVRFPGLLRALTLDEVNAAARRYLAVDRAAVVVAGPYEGR